MPFQTLCVFVKKVVAIWEEHFEHYLFGTVYLIAILMHNLVDDVQNDQSIDLQLSYINFHNVSVQNLDPKYYNNEIKLFLYYNFTKFDYHIILLNFTILLK